MGQVSPESSTPPSNPSGTNPSGTNPSGSEPSGSEPSGSSLPARVRAAVRHLPHPVRWVVVALVGGTLVLAGLAMLVLPGPGLVVLFAGVAVLAAEFAWAEVLLTRMKAMGQSAWATARRAGGADRRKRGAGAGVPPDAVE